MNVKSALYAIPFYVGLAVVGIGGLPLALTSRRAAMRVIVVWAGLQKLALRWLMGVETDVRGLERLPSGPFIIAIQHQSTYDTIAPFLFLSDPAFILKQELLKAPVFGYYAKRAGMIPIDRDGGMKTMREMLAAARKVADDGRPIVIFPEGTRQPVGAPCDLKPGVAALYRALSLPCVPVALNTGVCWPGSGLPRSSPGAVTFDIQEPIPPGLSREAFMDALRSSIETASARLLAVRADGAAR
jgi:1-acyl-sn-glycerol-3-phosphate acyltransferase